MITKREFSAYDAHPFVLYAKKSGDATEAFPVIVSSQGSLLITQGLVLPVHDQQVIDEADPNNVTITYKLSGVTVGTKTIVVSGTTTTISVTYV